jgi:hypothetical protein
MTRRDDGKTRALAASRTLNPRPEKVTDPAFAPGSFFDPADLVQLQMRALRGQRVQAPLGAPGQVAAQVRFGVLARAALEAGQVGGYR